MKVKAVGYIRVSTQEQLNGGGLDIQRDAIRKFVAEKDMTLVGIHSDEGVSGTVEVRMGLAGALERLEQKEATVLVVYRLDRLARDVGIQEYTLGKLRKQGITVLSVTEEDIDTDDPTRTLVRQMLGAIAQYEAALIRGRLASGRAAKRAKGGWLGGNIPYGYRAEDGELVPVDSEQAAIDFACTLRCDGLSLRQVARSMTEAGYRPKRASKWTPETVRAITTEH